MRGVGYHRRFSESRLFLGETLTVSCIAANRGRWPLISLHINDSAPRGFEPATDDGIVVSTSGGRWRFSHLMALLPGEQASRRIALRPIRRGYYVFGAAELQRGRSTRHVRGRGRISRTRCGDCVSARFLAEALGIPTSEPYGALQALRGLIEDPARIVGA